MPAERHQALLESTTLEDVEKAVHDRGTYRLTRREASGRDLWTDIVWMPVGFLLLDVALTKFMGRPISWESLVLGPTWIIVVLVLFSAFAGVSWFLSGTLAISVEADTVRHRWNEYKLSSLSLPRLSDTGGIVVTNPAGEELRFLGVGIPLDPGFRENLGHVIERLNEAILLREQLDAFTAKTRGPGGPYRASAASHLEETEA